MPALEESIVALLVRAGAIVFVALIAAAIVFRRQVFAAARAVRSDWRALHFRIENPIAIALLTVAAALLRFPYLSRTFGTDESATFLYYASKPLLIGLSVYGSPNNHLLHTALMHCSLGVFGSSEWALRLPAFIAGVAMVPLTSLAGGGVVAAAAVAAWPVLIDYSTDARGYTLLCCFVLIAFAAMREVKNGNRAAPLVFVIAAALGFFTVPVMVYPFVMLLIWCGWRRDTLICFVGTVALTFILYLPALLVSGVASIASNPYVRPLTRDAFARSVPAYVINVIRDLSGGVPVVLLAVIAIAFVFGVRRQRFWIGIIGVILLIAMQRVLPFPRVWLCFLPLVFMTCERSGELPQRNMLATILLIALATCSIAPRLRETGELRAAPEIARELRLRARPGDPVLTLPPSDMPLAFYAERLHVPVEIRFPDTRRPRVFIVINRDYGQSIASFAQNARLVRDFGSSALYVATRR